MRIRSLAVASLCMMALWSAAAPVAAAQGVEDASARAPRFLLAVATTRQPLDVRRVPVLSRRVALDLDDVTLREALAEITRQSGLKLAYAEDLVSTGGRVHLRASEISVAGALSTVLLDAGVDVVFTPDGHASLVKRVAVAPPAVGSIVGHVTDAKTQTALSGATVVVEGTRHSATTGNDGRYRIADVAPGTYTVRARYIGYAPASASVTVTADQEATADLALEKSAQRLDEVVTTGTIVPTEVKALPMPISVIDDSLISSRHPYTMRELFRQTVPTGVSWDYADAPEITTFSTRGNTTLNGTGRMKTFIDGVEVASPVYSPVDPNSIDHIEVIRGPQAAAIYGSDAIGGVIQIFTKRGDPTRTRPEFNAQAALGVLQTPYSGYGGVIRQTYSASVQDAGAYMSYSFGAGYSHTGDYLPNGELSAQSNPSAYGGMRFARGIVTTDVSARYYVFNSPLVINPEFAQTGLAFFTKPNYQPYQNENVSVGARLGVAPTTWWRHTVTVGVDHVGIDQTQTQPRLVSPADTLLTVSTQSFTKASIGYNTSLQGSLGTGLSGSLTAGFDHYTLAANGFFAFGALSNAGDISVSPDGFLSASRDITNNTGYFAQVLLGIRDALFLTGGLRAEQNTNFGDSLGTPLSPRVGVSYVQSLRGATLKVRGSWGRAIKPPSSGDKEGSVSSTSVTLANPELGPERQHGWDAGLDAVFGARGSLSFTYYDQTAENLLQFVQLDVPLPTFQWQNIGRVKNSGVEVEGTLNVGLLQLKGQYGYTRSRIEGLPPNYSGDLRIGDQVLATPEHTAGGSLAVRPFPGTAVSAGLTYVGSFDQYDFLALYRCFGGTGVCRPTMRDYITAFPSFVRASVTVSQRITPLVSGFVSVENLTNNQAYQATQANPVVGRTTTAGVQFRF